VSVSTPAAKLEVAPKAQPRPEPAAPPRIGWLAPTVTTLAAFAATAALLLVWQSGDGFPWPLGTQKDSTAAVAPQPMKPPTDIEFVQPATNHQEPEFLPPAPPTTELPLEADQPELDSTETPGALPPADSVPGERQPRAQEAP
jgi:hypothetical protein